MEVADTMVTTENDAAGVGTVAAGWEDESNETGWRTTWVSFWLRLTPIFQNFAPPCTIITV